MSRSINDHQAEAARSDVSLFREACIRQYFNDPDVRYALDVEHNTLVHERPS